MALNKKFYPNGGGFNLFPENVQIHKFNIFHQRGAMPESDTFTKEIEQLEIPEHVCRVKKKTFFSAKDNFTANLDNAIKKLRKVWDK